MIRHCGATLIRRATYTFYAARHAGNNIHSPTPSPLSTIASGQHSKKLSVIMNKRRVMYSNERGCFI